MSADDIGWIAGTPLIALLILVTARAMIDNIKYRRAEKKKRVTEEEGTS